MRFVFLCMMLALVANTAGAQGFPLFGVLRLLVAAHLDTGISRD